jgi:hypothetical protein
MAGNPAWTGTNFQSNGRWGNPAYSGANRAAVEQTFSLNPLTLAQTPLTLLSDFLGDAPASGATTFGDLVALDNGNFAIIEDDSSHAILPRECATACVIDPNGNTLTPAFAVDPSVLNTQGIWANCTAYKGGFCVRYCANLYFYDDVGNLRGSVTQGTSGLNFNVGRGDSIRIGSDIRSHYVYLAGVNSPAFPSTGAPVMVAIWDANTMQFVASADVSSDIDNPNMVVDRVDVSVDALDRFTVVWDCLPNAVFATQPINPATGNPTGEPCYQTVARVMALNGTNISYLTPSFFPFVNHDTTGLLTAQGLSTFEPMVAMTPRQILIACKGCVNSTNNPSAGPDTPLLTSTSLGTDMYTIIPHPAPMAAPVPTITTRVSGGNLVVSWNSDDGLFTVQTAPQVKASGTAWVNFTAGNVAPPVNVPMIPANSYIRLVRDY